MQSAQTEFESSALRRELQDLRGNTDKIMKILESQQQSMKEQEKKHQDSLESMEKKLAEEKLQAKVLQLEQQVEINKLKSEAKASQDVEVKVDVDKIVSLRGFDFKSVPKPDRYDLKPEKFNAWHDLFVATMAANDAQWESILETIEADGHGRS